MTDAEAYELRVGRWSRQVARQFLPWLGVGGGRDWLEVGCGAGALTDALRAVAAPRKLIACDRVPGGVARASFEALPFAAESFDVVVSALVIQFVGDTEAAMRESLRVARPGGVVAAYVWDFAEGMQLVRFFWDAAIALDPGAAPYDQAKRFSIVDEASLARVFRRSALQAVELRAFDVQAVLPDFDAYWEPMVSGEGSLPDYFNALAPARQEALRARLDVTLPRAADGTIRLGLRAWAARGRRA